MSAAPWKYGLAVLAGALIMGFTCFSAATLYSSNKHSLTTAIQNDSDSIANGMQKSLVACEQLVKNVQFLQEATPGTLNELFGRYPASSMANSGCSGITSLSLARLLLPEQREAFANARRASGTHGFSIVPPGERALYAPVTESLASPGNRALRAGRDLMADTALQNMLTQARDSGQAERSDPVSLTTLDGMDEPGFQIGIPVFRANAPHDSVEDRRGNIWGWIIATLSARRWILDALPPEATGLSVTVMTQDNAPFAQIGPIGPSSVTKLATLRKITFGNQEWALKITPGTDYISRHELGSPVLIVVAGILLTVAIWIILHMLGRRIFMTEQKNETLETAVQESDERWRFAMEGGEDGVWIWHAETGAAEFSPRCDTILGVPVGGAASARIHPDDAAPEKAAMQACLEGRSALYLSEHRMCGEDGKWRWISARGMVLARNQEGKALRMIGIITDITDRKTAAERINTLGQNDILTGLPNRTLFFSILQHAVQLAKRNKTLLALIYIDVDSLKSLNDNFGRMTTDRLLQELANTLKANMRDSDVVARFGGDDFAVLLPTISNAADVQRVTSKIQQSLSDGFSIKERHFSITVSMGVEIFPLHSRSAESLANLAQRAVRMAKTLGSNQVHIGNVPQAAPAASGR